MKGSKNFINLIVVFFVSNLLISSEYKYVVVKGDCLWNIAKKYYKNPFLWKKIYKRNIEKIKNPDLIYPGQIFIIPNLQQFISEESVELKIPTEEILQEKLEIEEIRDISEYEQIREKPKKYTEELQFVKKIKLKDAKKIGEIVDAKERKFVYIDYDIIVVKLENNAENVNIGDRFAVYHLGPSKYDLNLFKVPRDELNLVGIIEVREIKDNKHFIAEVIKTFSPIVKKDLIIK